MKNSSEVVITGMGIVSPIGIGRDPFWQSLHARRSGVRTIRQYDSRHLPVRIAAELVDFDAKQYVTPRKSLKVMSREIQIGVAAASLAVEDAQIDLSTCDSNRVGVVFGSQMLYGEIDELRDLYFHSLEQGQFNYDQFGQQFTSQLFPLWMLKYLPNMSASHIGIAHGARGPNNSIVLGDVSGLLAVIEGASLIQRGLVDVVLVGGGGTRTALTPLMYRGFSDLSRRNEEPERASRPFDLHRDGMVNGEGAGLLVLESREHARARNAVVWGSIRGWGSCHRGADATSTGMNRAIQASLRTALQNASLDPTELSHINAHGLGSPEHDAVESQAMDAICACVHVTSLKSFFGNLGPGGGVVELAASLIGRAQGLIPPTLNYETPDPQCPAPVVSQFRDTEIQGPFAKLSQAVGTGQTVCLIVG